LWYEKTQLLDFIFHRFILQFIVVKFLSIDDDEDEFYEVALSKWLIDLDENMIGNLFWPEDKSAAGMLVRTQINAQSNWSTYTVEVKRYYGKQFAFIPFFRFIEILVIMFC
jgi:hypothetical protein